MERLRAEVVKLFDDFSKNANASTSDVEHLTKAISSLFLQMQDVNLQANLTRDKFEALQKIVTNLDQLKGLATVGSDKNALSSVYPTVSQDSAEFKQVTTEATALKQMLTSVNTFAKLQDQILQKRKELGTDGNLAPVQNCLTRQTKPTSKPTRTQALLARIYLTNFPLSWVLLTKRARSQKSISMALKIAVSIPTFPMLVPLWISFWIRLNLKEILLKVRLKN